MTRPILVIFVSCLLSLTACAVDESDGLDGSGERSDEAATCVDEVNFCHGMWEVDRALCPEGTAGDECRDALNTQYSDCLFDLRDQCQRDEISDRCDVIRSEGDRDCDDTLTSCLMDECASLEDPALCELRCEIGQTSCTLSESLARTVCRDATLRILEERLND